jgi:hypothetical protein
MDERVRVSCPFCEKAFILTRAVAGKAVRCPGCQIVLRVSPELRLLSSPVAIRADRPGPAAGWTDAFEAEDDEPEAPPRPRRRRSAAGINPWIIVGAAAAVGLVVVLVVGAVVAIVLLRKDKDNPTPPRGYTTLEAPGRPGVPAGPADGRITPQQALAFNQAIAGANQRLATGGMNFGLALRPLTQGREADLIQVRRAYEDLKQAVQQVQGEVNALTVPPTASARRFYEAEQEFLKAEEKMVQGNAAEMVRVAENRRLPVRQRAARVQQIFQAMAQDEQRDLQTLQAAQQVFARENNIRLLPG